MKDIHPGDIILGADGNPTKVLWESQIFTDKDCYELEFDSGEKIIASCDHLWKVNFETDNDSTIISTVQLKNRIKYNNDKPYIIAAKNTSVKKHLIKSIIKTKTVKTKCIAVDNVDKLFLCGKTMIPTHNSTIAASLLAHVLTFYPGTKAVIINMDQGAGLENINKVRFVLENLPPWMRFIPKRSQQHKHISN